MVKGRWDDISRLDRLYDLTRDRTDFAGGDASPDEYQSKSLRQLFPGNYPAEDTQDQRRPDALPEHYEDHERPAGWDREDF